ncbi:putative carbonic anhydrase [Acropora cervicornis]|uniref:Carbonic anhydrase n=1 Tax=Acropora cervicornis TaxID=6130 RepID=A0AAD9R4A2_ACRCE|nr:putative carbonic anhydrase [Acropora cervicornis]
MAASLEIIPFDEKFKYGETKGDFLGPSEWGRRWPQCDGRRQSPINIRTRRAINRRYRPLIMTFDTWRGLVTGTLKNTRHYPMLEIDEGRGAKLRGGPLRGTYTLKQFHFHFGCANSRGSEHTRNGRRFSGELHLVFKKTTARGDEFAVVALWVQAPSRTGSRVLGRFADLTRKIIEPDSDETVRFSDGIFIRGLIPRRCNKRFSRRAILNCYYTYKGSLTTPICSENVTWLIVKPWLPATNNMKENDHKLALAQGFDRIENPRRYLYYHYRFLHLSDTEKKLGAAKLCKNLLREPSDEAALFTSHVTETIGRSLSDPAEDSRLVTIVPTDQSRVA